jgi:hypothetical protein
VLLVGTHLDSLPTAQRELDDALQVESRHHRHSHCTTISPSSSSSLQRIENGLARSVFSRSRFEAEALRRPKGLEEKRSYFAISSQHRQKGDLRLLKEVSGSRRLSGNQA